MAVANLSMSDRQFQRLGEVIYQRSGIHFPANKKYVLESRLARRLEELKLENYDQYITFLTIGPYQNDEFQEMFNRITINETSFFRNQPQLDWFESVALAGLLEKRKATKTLRIWSAACSTGEEPYTLAIQLHRSLGVRLGDWRIEILGTDISEKVLTAAQHGRYASYAVRSVNPMVMGRYFRQTGGFYQIDPTVQSMVRFELLNLKDAAAARRFGMFDAIFCRNVLIYFDDAMRRGCTEIFHRQLADDGYLLVGHSETLRQVTERFASVGAAHAFAYAKTRPGHSGSQGGFTSHG